jgi:hypothetical protein
MSLNSAIKNAQNVTETRTEPYQQWQAVGTEQKTQEPAPIACSHKNRHLSATQPKQAKIRQ